MLLMYCEGEKGSSLDAAAIHTCGCSIAVIKL